MNEDVKWFCDWAEHYGLKNRTINAFSKWMVEKKYSMNDLLKFKTTDELVAAIVPFRGFGTKSIENFLPAFETLKKDWLSYYEDLF